MTLLTLPSGQTIDFGDMDKESIKKTLQGMQAKKPELFQEAKPKYAPEIFAEANKQRLLEAEQQTSEKAQQKDLVTNDGEVQSHAFQYYYGKADNDKEREMRLTREFGDGTFQKLGTNDYMLLLDNISTEKKRQYDLPEDGTIRVNKKGFSRYDLSRFTGEYRGPLLATTAAGLAFTGVGILPSMAIMGVAGAAGKAYDELVSEEYFEDLQGQSKSEIYGDIAQEGVTMALGEGIFRGLFAGARRLIKGPGPKPNEARVDELIDLGASPKEARKVATEEARFEMRTAIKEGARPNINEASGKAFLGRMQAIYEAIIPNRGAAVANRNYVKKVFEDFNAGKLTETELKQTLQAQADDVSSIIANDMKDPNKAFKQAKERLNDVIKKELDELDNILSKGAPNETQASFFETLYEGAAKLWKTDSDALFRNAESLIGTGKRGKIDALPGLVKLIEDLQKDVFKRSEKSLNLFDSGVMVQLRKKIGFVKDPEKAGVFVHDPSQQKAFTIKEINSLRQALRALSKDPSVAPGTLDNDIGRVIEQINKSIDAKQIELGLDLAKATAKKDIIGIEKVQRGFDALRQANEYYSDGAKMFLNNNVKTFLRKVKEKEVVDLNFAMKSFKEQPGQLDNFLQTITPDQTAVSALAKTPSSVFNELASYAKRGDFINFNKLVKQKKLARFISVFDERIDKLPKDLEYVKYLGKQVGDQMDTYATLATRKADPNAFASGVKEKIANNEMKNLLTAGIGKQKDTFDFSSFSGEFQKNRQFYKKVFDKDTFNSLENIVNDSFVVGQATLKDLSPLGNLTLKSTRSMVEDIQNNLNSIVADSSDDLFKALSSGKVDNLETITTGLLKNPESYQKLINKLRQTGDQGKRAADAMEGFVSPEGVYQPGIKDYVMQKVLSAGFPDGISADLVQSGKFADPILKNIDTMNQAGALDTIIGKEQIRLLREALKNTVKMSDQSFKGQAGLAPAAFIAGAGLRAITAPLSFLGEVSAIFFLGKALRTETVLKSLTQTRLSSRDLKRARELGAGLDDLSVRNMQIKEFINQNARKYATLTLADTGESGAEAVEREIITPGVEELEKSGVQIPTKNQIVNQASNALKQVEQDKLLGIS